MNVDDVRELARTNTPISILLKYSTKRINSSVCSLCLVTTVCMKISIPVSLHAFTASMVRLNEPGCALNVSYELGLARFVITGGEPLVFKDLDQIVEAIDPQKFYINIFRPAHFNSPFFTSVS